MAETELAKAGISYSSSWRVGDVAEEVARQVRKDGIDIVVCGSHGHNAFVNLALGSVATMQGSVRCLRPRGRHVQVGLMLADEAVLVMDRAKAREMYHRLFTTIWEDAPWLFLHYQPELIGADKRITGFTPLPDEWLRFAPIDLPA